MVPTPQIMKTSVHTLTQRSIFYSLTVYTINMEQSLAFRCCQPRILYVKERQRGADYTLATRRRDRVFQLLSSRIVSCRPNVPNSGESQVLVGFRRMREIKRHVVVELVCTQSYLYEISQRTVTLLPVQMRASSHEFSYPFPIDFHEKSFGILHGDLFVG